MAGNQRRWRRFWKRYGIIATRNSSSNSTDPIHLKKKILPAFSVIDPERAGASFGSFSHAAPTAHATPQSDTGPAPALVDLKTALETLPVLELHRVRVSDDSDRIYGSVTAEDIAGELKNRWNVIVDKANIHVAGGRFKEVGVKQVVVTISDTESVTLSISIKDFGEGGASAPATQS